MSKKQLIFAITNIANKRGETITVSCGIIYPTASKDYKNLTFWNFTERLKHEPEEYMLLIKLRKYDLEEIYAELLGFKTLNRKGNPYFYKNYTYDEMKDD